MPLEIIRNDIVGMKVDAIVNPTDTSISGNGSIDKRIQQTAGDKFRAQCVAIGNLDIGKAKITKGYLLKSSYVIHTAGPVWQGGNNNEEVMLKNCYINSLKLAKEYHLKSVAFPLISSGTYGYPKDKALKTAVDTIGDFLIENDMLVYLVVFDKNAFKLSEKLLANITQYIDDNYVDLHTDNSRQIQSRYLYAPQCSSATKKLVLCQDSCNSLDDMLEDIDESFSQMLLRKIDELGLSDAQCYKKANIDRKLFSKIRSDIHYKPSKKTVLAFAVALELSLNETEDMLKKAGFALSHSNKFDIIVEYFIANKNYNIFEINEALFAFDQSLLGA